MQQDFWHVSKRKTRIRKDPCHKTQKRVYPLFPRLQFPEFGRGHGVFALEIRAVGAGILEAGFGGHLLDGQLRVFREQAAGVFQAAVPDKIRQAAELTSLREGGPHLPVGKVEQFREFLPVKGRIQKQTVPLDGQAQLFKKVGGFFRQLKLLLVFEGVGNLGGQGAVFPLQLAFLPEKQHSRQSAEGQSAEG